MKMVLTVAACLMLLPAVSAVGADTTQELLRPNNDGRLQPPNMDDRIRPHVRKGHPGGSELMMRIREELRSDEDLDGLHQRTAQGPPPPGGPGRGRGGPPGGPPPEGSSPDDGRFPPHHGPAPGEWGEEDVVETIEMIRLAKLSRELELDDESTITLVRRYQALKEEIAELHQAQRKLMSDLRRGLKSDAANGDLEAKLDELISHDAKVARAKMDAFEEMAEGLTTAKRARLYVFIRDFDEQIRRMVERAKDQRRGPWGRHDGSGRDDRGGRRGGPGYGSQDGRPGGPSQGGRDGRRGGPGGGPPGGGPPPPRQ
jgi:hypothetical protein